MLRKALQVGDSYKDTVFAGAMGMMAREYAEELKQTEQYEYNRLRQAGDIFKHYITEGDGLRVAAAERVSVYDVQISNAYKQASQFKNLTIEFMRTCR
ncbi:TPA: ParA family protein, partial [Escherichia coli]